MSWPLSPGEFAARVEQAMVAAGWSAEKRADVLQALAADDGPASCPYCGAGSASFRRARPGERLTYYCTNCGAEGPTDMLELTRELIKLEFAT